MTYRAEPAKIFAELLREQHLVFARRQVHECGISDATLRWRTRPGGPWQRLLPGVYLACAGTPTADQRDMAALLFAGTGSVLTGLAGLRRIGVKVPPTPVVDVLIPATRKRASCGFVRVHRTTRIPGFVCASGRIRFVWVARAVADAARGLTDLPQVRALVSDSVRRGWCRLGELEAELSSGPVAGSALFRHALGEVAHAVRSMAEADLVEAGPRGGPPMPLCIARPHPGRAFGTVLDAWWPEAKAAVEVGSRRWHLSPQEWDEVVRRHTRVTTRGILLLRFTPKQVRTEQAQVIAAVRGALAVARAEWPSGLPALPGAPALPAAS